MKPNGRCHSWRPGPKPHEPRHDPGSCHRCWRPCWNKVPRDELTVRCSECVEAILALNTPRLTRLLLEEPYVPERLSERLVTDFDAGVAMAASERLGSGEDALETAFASTAELEPVTRAPDVATSVSPDDEQVAVPWVEPEPAAVVPSAPAAEAGLDDEWGGEW